MPRVPRSDTFISTDVPGTTNPVAQQGIPGGAAQKFGRAVADVSSDLHNKLQAAEARDFFEKHYYDDYLAATDELTRIKNTSPDGYVYDDEGNRVRNKDKSYRTISQQYRDFLDQRFRASQDMMPSQVAQDMYRQRAMPMMTDLIKSAKNEEWILRSDAYKRGLSDRIRRTTNRIQDGMTPGLVYEQIQDHQEDLLAAKNNGVMSPEEHYIQNRNVITKSVNAYFDNLENLALSEPKKGMQRKDYAALGLATIRGEDAESITRRGMNLPTFNRMLDGETRDAIEKKFLRLLQTATKVDLSDLRQRTAAAMAELHAGRKIDENDLNELIGMWSGHRGAGDITDFEFVEGAGGLFAMGRAAPTLESPYYLTAPPREKERIRENLVAQMEKDFRKRFPEVAKVPSYAGGKLKQSMEEELRTRGEKQDNHFRSDFAEAAGEANSRISAMADRVPFDEPNKIKDRPGVFKQYAKNLRSMGKTHMRGGDKSNFRIMTKEASRAFSYYVMNAPSGDVADTLFAWYNEDKASYHDLITQMVKDGNLSGEWRLAGVVPDRFRMSEIVTTIRDAETIRKVNLPILNEKGSALIDLEYAASKQLGPYFASMASSKQDVALSVADQKLMMDVVTTKALMLYGQTNGAKQIDQYIKDAAESILGSRWKNVNVGGTFMAMGQQKSYVNIPRIIDGVKVTDEDVVQIRKNMEVLRDESWLKKLNIDIPLEKGQSLEQFRNEFITQISNTSILAPSADGRGVHIKYWARDKRAFVTLMVKTEDGRRPYFEPFLELARKKLRIEPPFKVEKPDYVSPRIGF